jgi:hypothetical protein
VERSGRSSSFDITARYGLNNYEIGVQFISSRLMGPTYLPVQQVLHAVLTGVNQPGCKADYLSAYSTEI